MPLSLTEAKRRLGIPLTQRIRTRADWEIVQQAAKPLLVAARRAGDDERAALISEARARLKACFGIGRLCPECGEAKRPDAELCRLCATHKRFHSDVLTESLRTRIANCYHTAIVHALSQSHGNRRLAAARLGISLATLYRHLSTAPTSHPAALLRA